MRFVSTGVCSVGNGCLSDMVVFFLYYNVGLWMGWDLVMKVY
jgi:hypothetical protein